MPNKRTHYLKTWSEYFNKVLYGEKKFELRKDDRDYKVGDYLYLKEWDNNNYKYTGRYCLVKIDYILRNASNFGLIDGYCLMSISGF